MWLSSTWSACTRALVTVRPLCAGTAKDFVGSGTWRSRARGLGERPSVSREIRALVCHMASPNALWGCAAHPRRAHQARDRDLAAHGRPASAAPRASAVAVVARVPGEPSWCSGLDGFLRRTDRDIPRALRSAHSGSRVPPHPSISPSPTRRRLRGQRSKLPRRSHGKRLRGVSAEIATRPTAWSSASGSNEWASPN